MQVFKECNVCNPYEGRGGRCLTDSGRGISQSLILFPAFLNNQQNWALLTKTRKGDGLYMSIFVCLYIYIYICLLVCMCVIHNICISIAFLQCCRSKTVTLSGVKAPVSCKSQQKEQNWSVEHNRDNFSCLGMIFPIHFLHRHFKSFCNKVF